MIETTHTNTEEMWGVWLDGKTIYKKTVSLGTLPNATTNSIAHNISDIDQIVKIEGIARNSSGRAIPLPHVSTYRADYSSVALSADKTNITVWPETDRSDYTGEATIYYTKTVS